MTTTTSEAIEFWKTAIKEQAESGLTVAEYCQLIEKSTYQFYYWKRRIGNRTSDIAGPRMNDTSGFIEIQPERFHPCSLYELSDHVDIRVGSFSIRFTEHTDRALFKTAASVLLEVVG